MKVNVNYDLILRSATKLAEEIGFDKITIMGIARKANLNHALIYKTFDSIESIKSIVIEHSIDKEIISIVLDAILRRRIKVKSLKDSVKDKIINKVSELLGGK